MRAQGFWGNELLVDHLDHCIAQAPEKTAMVDFNSMLGTGRRLSYRQFGDLVDRIAVGLADLGIEKDDVVACQLPNWWQFAALAFACWRIGAVINPMMPMLSMPYSVIKVCEKAKLCELLSSEVYLGRLTS